MIGIGKKGRLFMIYDSFKPEDTYGIGREMGEQAVAGQVYCLIGDLGAGKTLFTQGFAKGIGIDESVNSPTFTIVQEYEQGRLPFYHFDVYRISDPDEMYEIGYEEYFYGQGVCLVEWANLIEELIPEGAIVIQIDREPERGFDYRKITVHRES